MATIKDVAKMAGVSIATVSNVLHGKVTVNDEIAKRVREVIETLNYHPNMLASNLRNAKTVFIGVVVPSMDSIFSQLIDGILKYYERSNVHLIIKKTNDFRNVEAAAINDLINLGVKGIIMVTCNAADTNLFQRARNAGTHLLFVIRSIADKSFSTICFDNHVSIFNVTNHLLTEQPSAHVMLVTGPTEFSSELDCLNGYSEACQKHGVTPIALEVPINKQQAFYDVLSFLESCGTMPDHFIASGRLLAQTLQEVTILLRITGCPILSLDGDDWYQLRDESNYVCIHRNALRCGELAAESMDKLIQGNSAPLHLELPTATFRKESLPLTQRKHTIRILMVSGLTTDSIIALLPDFISSTGIQVEYSVCDNHFSLYNRILAGKKDPAQAADVLMLDYLWEQELIQDGYLQNIRPMLDACGDDLIDHFIPTIRHTFVEKDGSVYALPVATGSQMLLYRKDLFENPELKHIYFAATGTELHTPSTWGEFNSVARFFTRKHTPNSPVEYGTCLMGYNPHGLVEEFLPRLWANRGSLFSDGHLQLYSPKAVRALKNLCEAMEYSFPDITDIMETQQMSVFSKGDIAMINTFSLHIPSIYNIQQEWLVTSLGMCMLPGKRPMLGEWMMGIAGNTGCIEESFAFLKWVTSNRLCVHGTALGGFMPKKKVIENCELDSIYPWKKNIEQYLKVCRDVDPIPGTHGWLPVNDVYSILGTCIEDAIYERATPEQALWEANAKLHAQMK